MALHPFDRNLLDRCLSHKPRAWEDFVDRFLGLVTHVVNHTARSRSIRLTAQDFEDLVSDVFMAIIEEEFAVLRRFRGQCSLATYLTVVARRVVVRELLKRKTHSSLGEVASEHVADHSDGASAEERISDRDEVERLLRELNGPEAEIVRMYHLEGKSYEEISSSVGMPAGSVGPTLSRARAKLRRASET